MSFQFRFDLFRQRPMSLRQVRLHRGGIFRGVLRDLRHLQWSGLSLESYMIPGRGVEVALTPPPPRFLAGLMYALNYLHKLRNFEQTLIHTNISSKKRQFEQTSIQTKVDSNKCRLRQVKAVATFYIACSLLHFTPGRLI